VSTEPIRAHDALWEVIRLREEIDALVAEINSRGKTRPLLLRARNLRKRLRAQSSTIDRLLLTELGTEVAFRERLGRDPVEGDIITPEDDARAAKFVAMMGKAGTC
jgi:hypothetical protein